VVAVAGTSDPAADRRRPHPGQPIVIEILERLNTSEEGSGAYADTGLGEAGEAYLAGEDGLMRSRGSAPAAFVKIGQDQTGRQT
jgi:hypothetical protein